MATPPISNVPKAQAPALGVGLPERERFRVDAFHEFDQQLKAVLDDTLALLDGVLALIEAWRRWDEDRVYQPYARAALDRLVLSF